MRDERLLLIGGWHLLGGLNHRIRHVAAYLERHFTNIDIVGFQNFYDGPPAASWTKLRKGISNLLSSSIKTSESGTCRRIIIRDLYAPQAVQMPVKDLWRYFNLKRIIALPYDMAIFGYPGNAWVGALLKRTGLVKRLIYDDWDYHPGLENSHIARTLVDSRERLCVRESDAVITVNDLLADLRKRQGAKKVMVVPNGVDTELFVKAIRKSEHPPTLVYMGSLSALWGIDLAIRAMPTLAQYIPNIRLLIAGYGPAEYELKTLCRTLNVADRVIFLGRHEYQGLPSILAQSDVGIVISLPGSSFRYYASPLKLIEYMAAGLPVIASRWGQTEKTMEESNAGILIDHKVEEFVSASLMLLKNNRKFYDKCSRAGVAFAAGFDWALLSNQFYGHIVEMLDTDLN